MGRTVGARIGNGPQHGFFNDPLARFVGPRTNRGVGPPRTTSPTPFANGPHLHPLQLVLAVDHGSGYIWGMALFPVSPEKEAQLVARMGQFAILEADIEESFVRSGGHGGQNVNKTSTCVMLLHVPTGLQVKCQETRQQGMNRYLARRLLVEKVDELRRGKLSAVKQEEEKIRRQKRRRSRRSKQRMLADKSAHADKKENRRRVSPD